MNGRSHRLGLALLAALLAGSVAAAGGQARRAAVSSCPPYQEDYAYDSAVQTALSARSDIWGNQLLSTPGGPTYAAARSFLHPLMLVGPPSGKDPHRMTDSGVYYLALGLPDGKRGGDAVDLHVADGSQVVSGRIRGPSLTVSVGQHAAERYGSCLRRLATPKLADGYLPILKTSYRDATGVRYTQESFAARIPETHALVSFVRVTIDPRGSGHARAVVRFTASPKGLRRVGNELRRGRRAALVFSPGARVGRGSVSYRTVGGRKRTVYVAWISKPSVTKPFRLGRSSYTQARHSVARYWTRRLASAALLTVPDRVVMNAERNLLIQDVTHSWRYSLGNPYERFSWELIGVAQTMGAYGFTGVEREMIAKAFQRGSWFPNRADGERMIGAADYFRRTGNARFVREYSPYMQGALGRFELQLAGSTTGLLDPERYGMDVPDQVYGLHDQALVLEGLRAMAGVWTQLGATDLATRATRDADELEAGLRAAVQTDARPLPDGSLFIPVTLLDPNADQPYGSVTDTLFGSYWNLVMPYALASGFFQPGSPEATGLLRYLQSHGSRLLGLVRFRAFTNSGKPGYRAPGVDDVYGLSVARFLADNEQPDQLILSLYGKLGADMTPGTFVSGEGSTVGPVAGEYYRSMFRSPNAVNNAFFLETLRLMLVHETRDATGTPNGLELAYSTPRRWLVGGRRVAVRGMRTSFGPLSYSLRARHGSVTAHLTMPRRLGSASLKLRLRLPNGERITSVSVNGHVFERFDAASETIDLTGLHGRVDLVASVS